MTTTVNYLRARNALKHQIFEDLKAIAKSGEQHILSLMGKIEIRTADFSTDGFIRRHFEISTRRGNAKQHAMVRLNKYLAERKVRNLSLNLNLIAIALMNKDGKGVSSADERLIGRDFSPEMRYFWKACERVTAKRILARCILPPALIQTAPLFLHLLLQGMEGKHLV